MKFTDAEKAAFAARLTAARAARRMTREAVVAATTTLTSAQQLYNYEKGRRVPETIAAIADLEQALNLQPGDLTVPLGFVKVGSEVSVTPETAIALDPDLDADTKEHILTVLSAARHP